MLGGLLPGFSCRLEAASCLLYRLTSDLRSLISYPLSSVICRLSHALCSMLYASSPQALPFRLKKNFKPFFTLSEKILAEKKFPATLLLISPSVG